MGTIGRTIVNLDVKMLVDTLNKAYADEWLAYYQYWIGAKVAQGMMRESVVKELEEHASEELEHAGMLVERIIQLGGIPLLDPNMWAKEANCAYEVPSDPDTKMLLKQNIKGEQCAIKVYSKILKMVEGKDPITYQIVLKILQDEVKHEEDLEAILNDFEN